MKTSRRAVSLLEMMIVVAIVAVLVAMLLPAVQKAREAAQKIECVGNLKQLGIAARAYHEAYGEFPRDSTAAVSFEALPASSPVKTLYIDWTVPGGGRSYFESLLAFVEEKNQSLSDPLAIKTLLCPGRRDVATAGARADYGLATHPDLSYRANYSWQSAAGITYYWRGAVARVPSTLDATPFAELGNDAAGKLCVMGFAGEVNVGVPGISRNPPGVKGSQIRKGTSHTLLLAHKGMSPKNYASGPNDEGWTTHANLAEHSRKPDAFGRDGDRPNIEYTLSSPHHTMPCLWADGRVGDVSYRIESAQLWPMWAYNDPRPSNVPEY